MVEITKEFHKCKHEKAFYYTQDADEYEGRVYDHVYCPECNSFWEERYRQEQHVYPKGKLKEYLK